MGHPSSSRTPEVVLAGGYARAEAMGIVLRPMTDADMGFLSALYASTREEELSQLPWDAAQKRDFLEMQFHAQHAHYQAHYPDAAWLVVEHGNQPAGRLYIEEWPSELRIIDIALMPAFRGRGLGAALLRDIMEKAETVRKAVGIHVEKANPAMRLYHRLGFRTIEDKGVYDLLRWSRVGA
ncbi:MAG: GNAT family N-acetyltransferase [Hoeflea sp. D1-CHI-28]|uniref:GNAT family N-acetyltransferase n=1 Tax=Hoeflea sp. TaxID=1940281 RepID=UPI0032ED463D